MPVCGYTCHYCPGSPHTRVGGSVKDPEAVLAAAAAHKQHVLECHPERLGGRALPVRLDDRPARPVQLVRAGDRARTRKAA